MEEKIQHEGEPGSRVIKNIWDGIDLSQDFGEIKPHKKRFPISVERALFALLLVPWEDLTEHSEYDWRSFRFPWIYTINEDIFERPAPPPSPDTLSWEPKFFENNFGETVESEVPIQFSLVKNASDKLLSLNDSNWSKLCETEGSPLFETPIEHFFVRTFLNDDIDEFLAHILVIEAALGLEIDFQGKQRPRFSNPNDANNKNAGATIRMATRLSKLIKRPEAVKEFKQLFDIRSKFIHGHKMSTISSSNKILARRLAREAINGLITSSHTSPPPSSRDEFLTNLLFQ